MKKFLAVAVLMFAFAMPSPAVDYKFGPLNVNVPFTTVNAVYLYDVINRETLLGAETPVASYKNIQAVIGAVGDVEKAESKAGIPFLGVHIWAPEGLFSEKFTLGIFGGRDWDRGETIGGVKASMNLWSL